MNQQILATLQAIVKKVREEGGPDSGTTIRHLERAIIAIRDSIPGQ